MSRPHRTRVNATNAASGGSRRLAAEPLTKSPERNHATSNNDRSAKHHPPHRPRSNVRTTPVLTRHREPTRSIHRSTQSQVTTRAKPRDPLSRPPHTATSPTPNDDRATTRYPRRRANSIATATCSGDARRATTTTWGDAIASHFRDERLRPTPGRENR